MPPIYRALDPNNEEIRVLTLLPGKADDPIHCTLRTISLNDSPTYEALSYVWGDPEIQREVFVDEHATNVTVNLEAAIRALRRQETNRTIWADAICINQGDVLEKNSQVPLMSRVYTQASSVVVWLGASDANISDMLSFLARFDVNECQAAAEYLSQLRLADLNRLRLGEMEILSAPYWRRMWTFQEFRLAETEPLILCGSGSFYLSQLVKVDSLLVAAMREKQLSLEELRTRFQNLPFEDLLVAYRTTLMDRTAYKREQSLIRLLRDCRACRSQDPRDNVYALYGLLPNMRKALPPDYAKPARQVFHETTTYLIRQQHGNWGELTSYYCLYEDRLHSNHHPSWIPELSMIQEVSDSENQYLSFRLTHRLMRYEEGGFSLTLSKDNKTIHMQARFLGECQVIVKFKKGLSDITDQTIHLLEPRSAASYFEPIAVADPIYHLARAVFAQSPSYGEFLVDEIRQQLEALRKLLHDTSSTSGPGGNNLARQLLALRGKAIIRSSTGFLGVAGADVEKGDLVVVSDSLLHPMVLRKQKPTPIWARLLRAKPVRSYRLVGHAYIDGIMDNDCYNSELVDRLLQQKPEKYNTV